MTTPNERDNKTPPEGYVIDTNVFLNFWKLDNDEPYGKDVHQSAWKYIEKAIEDGRIIAPMSVKKELEKHGSPELLNWIKAHQAMFIPRSSEIIPPLRKIVKLHPAYKNTRSSEADAIIVALAFSRNLGVITSEKWEPDGNRSSRNPKIPNICEDLDVPWFSVTTFFRNEGQSF